jgi:exosortase K
MGKRLTLLRSVAGGPPAFQSVDLAQKRPLSDEHMMSKRDPVTIAQVAVILAAAFALKYFYSTASVNGLRWILAPTAFLVEVITGTQFRFESQAGYLSDDRTFLIAQPCSGVNFLIIAFLVLAIGNLRRAWPQSIGWRSILVAAGVAYVATLAANTTRIVVALKMRGLDFGYDYEDVHRIEGIIVYFGFLLLLFLASEKYAATDRHGPQVSRGRQVVIPLLIYYGVTLGLPLAGGAFRDAAFWKHALVVFVTSTILMLPFLILYVAKAVESSKDEVPWR